MIVGLITFIIFLFIMFVLAKDDFVFLRKNVSLEQIFNYLFLGTPVVLFFARLAYVLFHPKWSYLNPLVFFIIPYFPGLFIGGGVLGAIIFTYIVTQNKKIPFFRLLDELGLAFLISAGFYFFISSIIFFIQKNILAIPYFVLSLLYGIGYTLVKILFIKEKWIDGTIAAMVLIFHSLFSLCYFSILVVIQKKFSLTPEEIFYVVFLIISVVFFAVRRNYLRLRR